MSGSLVVVGLGPGDEALLTPAAAQALADATDLVGYGPYVDRVVLRDGQTKHRSGNRVEANRSRAALDMAAEGKRVAVVSSGDPGVFAMATAVWEEVEQNPQRWADVDVRVIPGVTAATATAAASGAILGHDFCIISLSDILKPWEVVEKRLEAAGAADFVVALYNPISRHRPWQLGRALEILAQHRDPETPVVIGRAVTRDDERIEVQALRDVDPEKCDMSTMLIIGSSATRVFEHRGVKLAFTPRTYA